MKEGRKSNKIVSLVLAAIMMVSVFAVSTPEQVQAAGELSFKGSGTSTVAITDDECAYVTGKENYIKFKPSKTGYVTVTIKNNSTAASGGAAGFLTFCNGSKSSLGQNQEYFDTIGEGSRYYTRTYGVKKGKTYFFKIKSVGGVKITAKAVSVKKGTNNSRSKAKTLGKNKTAKGVIIAGENKADWYKIKVTKRQQVKINYNVKTNGAQYSNGTVSYYNGLKIALYQKNGKPFADGNNYYALANVKNPKDVDGPYYLYNSYTYKKSGIDPGTYYIKVERYNRTSSGYYTIKWK